MENINNPEENLNPAAETGHDRPVLSLDELIARIDSETADPLTYDSSEEQISAKSEKMLTSLQDQFILFTLEKTVFALPLSSALEIGRRADITPLPNLPNWVLGISNIRGEIVSFISLKAFLGIPSSGTNMDRRFLIIQNKQIKVGVIVDSIMGILSLHHIDIDLQKSPYRQGEVAKYIFGVALSGNNLTNILDIDKLLSSSRMNGFKAN